MPATLYLRPSPRAFFLITLTHALVFRQPDASETKASRSVVVAEFLPIDEVDMRGLVRASKGRTVDGVLGVTSVPTERSPVPEIFLLLLSASSPLPSLLPSSTLRPSRVIAVEFHSLSSAFWDSPELATNASSSSLDLEYEDPYDAAGPYPTAGSSTTQSQAASQGVDNPCNGMRKYLESGSFFYADGCRWDISSRMGETNWVLADKGIAAHPLETFDERFVWNASLLAPFLAFRSNLPLDIRAELDAQSLLIPVIQGFCGSLPVSTGAWTSDGRPEIAALGLVSRLSWKRAGARFRTRGIDDDGQVANFVETELILATDSVCLSYVQVRGSVPLFWQQPSQGIQTLQQKVELTRPPQATQPAFDKHFLDLLEHYHSVHAINLLGQKDAEAMLSSAYSDHLAQLQATLERTPPSEKGAMDAAPQGTLSLTPYDFHAAVKMGGHDVVKYDLGTRLDEVIDARERFGWTAVDMSSGQIIEQQQGVFRTNCLDCLDRTNYVQDVISSITLASFLSTLDSPLASSATLWSAHRELWADNGDRLSKIYAGTGAINTSATRSGKKTFAGLLSDATKSVGRAYINNFQDKGKQANIDMLLGMMAGQRPVILFDPISDSVHSALQMRINEYSQTRSIIVFSGTWNLNAKPPAEALDPWLFPPNTPEPDLYMIAFQEIVELTPGQILQTDPAKRRMWETYIMDTFATRKGEKSEYLLLRSEQLVGTALIIVIKSSLSPHIRSVESATKKTGLQGLSGNKGGVGIRLDLFDSSICLMTCHLAAGHSNVAERNADYRTINRGLKFLRGKTIEDHEIIIWGADFNYRIAMPNLDVRDCAEHGLLDPLLGADQLAQAMDEGEVFVGYDEGPITFAPTYKYDNGTDQYDTSEKARIPAWTDRILFKGSALRLKEYNRADLRTSDHRPVYAIFDATVREVDQAKKESISKVIVHSLRQSAENGKVDQKVERVIQKHGGVGDLLGHMTNTSSTPPRSISPAIKPHGSTQVPRLPPRPTAAVLTPERYRPRVSSASKSPQSSAANDKPTTGTNGFNIPRKPPPPLPMRLGSGSPVAASTSTESTSALPLNSLHRAPPPVPRNSSIASSSFVSARSMSPPPGSSSPTLTPASTGDYMVVNAALTSRPPASTATNAPPPLPARVKPEPRRTLDMNGSPPEGLIAPVSPVKSTKPPVPAKKPTLDVNVSATKGPISPVTSMKGPISPVSPVRAQKPPLPSKKPSLSSHPKQSGAENKTPSQAKSPIPQPKMKLGAADDTGTTKAPSSADQVESEKGLGVRDLRKMFDGSSSTSKEPLGGLKVEAAADKKVTPPVARKPIGLRSLSSNGPSGS